MTIDEFHALLMQEIKTEYNERLIENASTNLYEETLFLENALDFMFSNRMIVDEWQPCYYNTTYKNARILLHGYAISEDSTQLELFVCHYNGDTVINSITDSEIKRIAVDPCFRFLAESVKQNEGFVKSLEKSSEAFFFSTHLREIYNDLQTVKIVVITDMQSKSNFFKDALIGPLSVRIEVFDIERYYKIGSEGQPRDEILVDFMNLYNIGLPCVYVPKQSENEYAYALTAIPGQVIYNLYNQYGERILEDNVRSYLSARGKKNAGIQTTLIEEPTRFMAYNNGLVIVADSVVIKANENGESSILQIKGLQIVNGGQTTASIYFAKQAKKDAVDLGPVRVAAKIIEIGEEVDTEGHEEFIGNIARYANTQNQVKESDFLAHSAFQVNFERIVRTINCPDSVGQWFYERASGSYNTYLIREGKTPAKRKKITTVVIPRKRVVKKTDLAQSIATWRGSPHIAALGGEKCLGRYKDNLKADSENIDVGYVKKRLSEYIVYYNTFYLLRGDICKQSPGVVRIYLLALLAKNYEDSIDFDYIWNKQDLSEELKAQLKIWGSELYTWMIKNSQGRQLSEYGKNETTWDRIKSLRLSPMIRSVPEINH